MESQNDIINVQHNIIAGPGKRDYFFHSPGVKIAMEKEEGPLPVQGNIGAIMAQEALNYSGCTDKAPLIEGSLNCTDAFVPDSYTKVNTCDQECLLKYPESYGLKDFGFPEDITWAHKLTNSSSIHSFENLRAAGPGQGPGFLGPIEWIPNVSISRGSEDNLGAGYLDPKDAYQQVGNFLKLPMYEDLVFVKYPKN